MRKETINRYRPTDVPSPTGALDRHSQAVRPWWAHPMAIILLTIFFTATDGVILFSVVRHSMQETPELIWVTAIGAALLLNVLPLVAVSFAKRLLYRTHRAAAVC